MKGDGVDVEGPPPAAIISLSLVLWVGFCSLLGGLFISHIFPGYIPWVGHRAYKDLALKGIQSREGS